MTSRRQFLGTSSAAVGFALGGRRAQTENATGQQDTHKLPPTMKIVESMSSELSEIVSVKDFGAKGDGLTDDTAAIVAAVAALPVAGGVINFPAGTYVLNASAIDPGAKLVKFVGVGWQTAVSAPFGDAQWVALGAVHGSVLKVTGTLSGITVTSSSYSSGLVLQDLAVLGPGTGTSVGVNLGPTTSVVRVLTRNVLIANFVTGLRLNNAIDHTYFSLHVMGCTTGVLFDGGGAVDEIQFHNLRIENCTTAANFGGGSGIRIYGGLVQSNGTGLNFAPAIGGSCTGVLISGVWFEANTHSFAFDSTHVTMGGIAFENCRESTAFVVPVTVVNAISNLAFRSCLFSGISLTLATGINSVLVENTAFGTFDPTGAANVVVDNEVLSGSANRSFKRVVTAAAGATYTPDWRAGRVHELTLTQNITIAIPAHAPSDSTEITFIIRQNGTGAHTVAWGSGYHVSWSNTGNTAWTYSTICVRQTTTGQWVQVGAQAPYFA